MKILIVGAGIAGLTAAAFCAKENDGAEICVLEAASTPGGLVKGRWKDGFYLDQGVRAFEDAGILKPILRSLELDVPFLPNPVSLVVGDAVVMYHSITDLSAFLDVMVQRFPTERAAIHAIGDEIRRVSEYIGFVYSVDSPLFDEGKRDLASLKEMLPWLIKYPRVRSVDPAQKRCVVDAEGVEASYPYDVLIWAGDPRPLQAAHVIAKQGHRQPTESVLTCSVGLRRRPETFSATVPSHAFWTPRVDGISVLGPFPRSRDVQSSDVSAMARWLAAYLERTTFEISIPALRNLALAPDEATGVILSTILHQDVERAFVAAGAKDTFDAVVRDGFHQILERLVPQFTDDLLFESYTTPCDLEAYTLNAGGAISGCHVDPTASQASLVHAVGTGDPAIFQAGQWVV
ncbi:MAG: NAD(P)-binding protein [Peptoniphilaceae bacterium]|nr:NAD(P)-binding protein [Peptoniphilaceae bacterium]